MPIGCAGAITRGLPFEEFVIEGASMLGSQLGLSSAEAVESPLAAELAEARAYLVELEGMDEAAAQVASDADYAQQCVEWEERLRAKEVLRQRYQHTLGLLEAWDTNVEAYRALKSRLMEDIGLSIGCDCDRVDPKPVRMTAVQWRVHAMEEQVLLIQYMERKHRQSSVLLALRKSLGSPI